MIVVVPGGPAAFIPPSVQAADSVAWLRIIYLPYQMLLSLAYFGQLVFCCSFFRVDMVVVANLQTRRSFARAIAKRVVETWLAWLIVGFNTGVGYGCFQK